MMAVFDTVAHTHSLVVCSLSFQLPPYLPFCCCCSCGQSGVRRMRRAKCCTDSFDAGSTCGTVDIRRAQGEVLHVHLLLAAKTFFTIILLKNEKKKNERERVQVSIKTVTIVCFHGDPVCHPMVHVINPKKKVSSKVKQEASLQYISWWWSVLRNRLLAIPESKSLIVSCCAHRKQRRRQRNATIVRQPQVPPATCPVGEPGKHAILTHLHHKCLTLRLSTHPYPGR